MRWRCGLLPALHVVMDETALVGALTATLSIERSVRSEAERVLYGVCYGAFQFCAATRGNQPQIVTKID